MIYVTVGTMDYNFSRLMKGMEKLPESMRIEILAQIGINPAPDGINSFPYCRRSESLGHIRRSDIVITHGGSTLMEALLEGKKVIGIPRMKEFHEALNDHQVDLCVKLEEKGLILTVLDMADLEVTIERSRKMNKPDLKKGPLPMELIKLIDRICEHGMLMESEKK